MTAGPARTHGEDPVEQQDALLGPGCEVTGGRWFDAEVVAQLGVDVDQAAGQRRDVGGHREAEADWVAGSRVWVLADDEHADIVERLLEGPQDVVSAGQVPTARGDFAPEEFAELGDDRRDRCERGYPRVVHQLMQGSGRHGATVAVGEQPGRGRL